MQTFDVKGMSCQHCVRAVTGAIQAQDPAARAEVDLAAGQVRVDSTLSGEQVASLLAEEGYQVA